MSASMDRLASRPLDRRSVTNTGDTYQANTQRSGAQAWETKLEIEKASWTQFSVEYSPRPNTHTA